MNVDTTDPHPSIADFGTELELAMTHAAVQVIRRALESGRRPEDFKSSMVIATIGTLTSVVAATADAREQVVLKNFVRKHGIEMFDEFLEAKAKEMTTIKAAFGR